MRILGISPLHDSSVAVINDGKLEYFFKEERLSRIKRDGPPVLSLQKIAELVKDIDYACIAAPTAEDPCAKYIRTQVGKLFNCEVTDYSYHHHLSHASLAYFNSGFDECLVFVIDRDGSLIENFAREAETVFYVNTDQYFNVLHKNFWVKDVGSTADANKLNLIRYFYDTKQSCNLDSTMSIVKVYESATSLIGQNPLENGKTMGLASYGRDTGFVDLFKNSRPLDFNFVHGNFISSGHSTPIYKDYIFKLTNNIDKTNFQFYADYAFQVQKQTQNVALDMISYWVNKTGIKNVCITGGYGLNVIANQHYIKNLPDVNFYFEPLADDTGNSIGSALHLYSQLTKEKINNPITHTFFHGVKEPVSNDLGVETTISQIAEFLKEQKIVAVFNGLAEAGPRALGNRSILFDASNPEAKNIVNCVKKREWYRPFAGVLLEEDFDKCFETLGQHKSPFMTVSYNPKIDTIPGVTHVDNTCRVQTVSKDIDHLYKLLKAFKNNTGKSVLLNTSFNIAGEALVETVEDAVRTFNETNIDVLWFPEINRSLRKWDHQEVI